MLWQPGEQKQGEHKQREHKQSEHKQGEHKVSTSKVYTSKVNTRWAGLVNTKACDLGSGQDENTNENDAVANWCDDDKLWWWS